MTGGWCSVVAAQRDTQEMASSGSKVWVLTHEEAYPGTAETLSCLGVFSTRERALQYMRECVLDEDAADALPWESEGNPEFWEAWVSDEENYLLVTLIVDEPLP